MRDTYIHREISLKEKIWRIFKIFFIVLIIESLIIFILYIIIYSPIFKIQEIKINGLNQVSEKEINNFLIINLFNNSFIKKILSSKNILIWPENLDNNLKMFFTIKSVQIKKDFLNRKIEINVIERKPFGIWCLISQNECLEFDSDGILFKKTFLSEGNLILKINDYSLRNLNIGAKVLPDRLLDIFLNIISMLKQQNIAFSDVNIKDINLEEMEIKVFNGPKIYFSLRFPPPDVEQIIDDFKNKNIFNKLEYIDLRVENRVYYK
ncbi:MAG: FtsQ-type POTRA domain-containing protein [Patescibacteria group bacterium]|nr:FtsQ-type POTRA domain-containing protein [Patescibacteria group bacterium]